MKSEDEQDFEDAKRNQNQADEGQKDFSVAKYLKHLMNSTWFTADRLQPYLIKAGATCGDVAKLKGKHKNNKNIDQGGYAIIVTDLETTYFCQADR